MGLINQVLDLKYYSNFEISDLSSANMILKQANPTHNFIIPKQDIF